MIFGRKVVVSHCLTLATPWTVTCQAPLSVGFPRHEYWSGLPFFSPGDLPGPETEPTSALQVDSLSSEPTREAPGMEEEKVKVKALSRVRLFATLWTVAHQVPPSMGFSRQEY